VDAARAVDWVRANAAAYGIDPDRIAIGGHSAGGITSLGVAYRGPGEDGAEVRAVLAMSGGLYGTESFIEAGDPPLILLHGTADSTVPFTHAQAIVSRATAVGLLHEFYPLEGVGHQLFPELGRVVNGSSLEHRIADFMYRHLDLAGL
jgi:acetyl esterase/lipase